jgi:hypothetical protein
MFGNRKNLGAGVHGLKELIIFVQQNNKTRNIP